MDVVTPTDVCEAEDLATGRRDLTVTVTDRLTWPALRVFAETVAADYASGPTDLLVTVPAGGGLFGDAPAAPEIVLVDRVISGASVSPVGVRTGAAVEEPLLVASLADSVLGALDYFGTSRFALPRAEVLDRIRQLLLRNEIGRCQVGAGAGAQFALWADGLDLWGKSENLIELLDIFGPGRGGQKVLLDHVVGAGTTRTVRGNVAVNPDQPEGWLVLDRLRSTGWRVVGARWRFRCDEDEIAMPDRGRSWPEWDGR